MTTTTKLPPNSRRCRRPGRVVKAPTLEDQLADRLKFLEEAIVRADSGTAELLREAAALAKYSERIEAAVKALDERTEKLGVARDKHSEEVARKKSALAEIEELAASVFDVKAAKEAVTTMINARKVKTTRNRDKFEAAQIVCRESYKAALTVDLKLIALDKLADMNWNRADRDDPNDYADIFATAIVE